MLKENLTALDQNNSKLRTMWQQQQKELTRLQALSAEQSSELTKSLQELDISRNKLQLAKNSLKTAQEELDNALISWKKQQDREKRIKRQRNFWTMVSGFLAAGLIASIAR